MTDAYNKVGKVKLCLTCGAPTTKEARPFCSKRCADIDLGRWFRGVYAIPAFDAADDSIVEADTAVSDKFQQPDSNDGCN